MQFNVVLSNKAKEQVFIPQWNPDYWKLPHEGTRKRFELWCL